MAGAEFVEFLRERIILLYELLSDDGSMYLHLDSKMAFTMKLIIDEIFWKKTVELLLQEKNVVQRIIQGTRTEKFLII